jgi:hypothetical protein
MGNTPTEHVILMLLIGSICKIEESLEKTDSFEDLGVDARIILKWS